MATTSARLQIASLRLIATRRLLAWYLNLKAEANRLLEFYINQKMLDDQQAAYTLATRDQDLEGTDEEGMPRPKVNKPRTFNPRGPIGFLDAVIEPEFRTMEVP